MAHHVCMGRGIPTHEAKLIFKTKTAAFAAVFVLVRSKILTFSLL